MNTCFVILKKIVRAANQVFVDAQIEDSQTASFQSQKKITIPNLKRTLTFNLNEEPIYMGLF